MSISTFKIKQYKLVLTVTVLCIQFCMHEIVRKTILCARKSVLASIKFVEPRMPRKFYEILRILKCALWVKQI